MTTKPNSNLAGGCSHSRSPAGSPPVELDYHETVGIMCALAAGKIRKEAAARYIPEVEKLTTTALQIGEKLGALAEMEITLENAQEEARRK